MTSLQDIYDARIAAGTLERDPVQEAVLPEFERIRDAVAHPTKKGFFRKAVEAPKGLYLWGGVGRGKSMLMNMFAGALVVPVRRAHFHAFMQEIHAQMHIERQKGTEDVIRPVADRVAETARVLAFDEMQITDITDAMIVGRIFERLMDKNVTIVTTSNRVPDDLYKDGLNRQLFLPFIELIKTRMVVHEMSGPTDYRQGLLEGAQSYFTPANEAAHRIMDRIWDDLTHGEHETLTLHVKGRQVELPQYHAGVARTTFYDLCSRPLGAGDYLALADAVRVLMIENIPELGRNNFNEAKRFVTLIDALYEGRVRLIASAAAKPEMLYIEGEGSFEFERTASRLNEMQAADWGNDRA